MPQEKGMLVFAFSCIKKNDYLISYYPNGVKRQRERLNGGESLKNNC